MPSLDRAYGLRGAAIALAMALVAGAVHGVIASAADFVLVKIVIGIAGAIILLMAGAISARQWLGSAVALGLMMALVFFVARWSGWALMEGGGPLVLDFLSSGPLGWPGFLRAHDISGFWLVEAISISCPALFGCYVGHERVE